MLILRDVLLSGKRRYSEFLASDEKISTNILANRLAGLQANGILHKRGDEYVPTQKGRALAMLVAELALWGTIYYPQAAMPEDFTKWAQSDPERFRQEMARFMEKSQSRRARGSTATRGTTAQL